MDREPDLVDKLENMSQMGYSVMTVSELVSQLAGLPPMMDVYIDADGVSMFVNQAQVQEADGFPPFLRLMASIYPKKPPAIQESYEESLDRQKQRAMNMSAEIERAGRMPHMAD